MKNIIVIFSILVGGWLIGMYWVRRNEQQAREAYDLTTKGALTKLSNALVNMLAPPVAEQGVKPLYGVSLTPMQTEYKNSLEMSRGYDMFPNLVA